jgi:hypothetical protein
LLLNDDDVPAHVAEKRRQTVIAGRVFQRPASPGVLGHEEGRRPLVSHLQLMHQRRHGVGEREAVADEQDAEAGAIAASEGNVAFESRGERAANQPGLHETDADEGRQHEYDAGAG